jgi:D-alanine-D-alanine ligase
MAMHIAVLKGGLSQERDVSLNSGAAVARALRELGHEVSEIDATRDVAEQLSAVQPECVFNALHGRYGEDGCVQGVLETLGIPYTHSGVLASALAMDKPMAKTVFAAAGLACAQSVICDRATLAEREPMPRPYVIKPLNEGSSVGVVIVMPDDAVSFAAKDWQFGEKVMVEQFVPGREIQVAVLNDEALGAIEIKAQGRFYDYQAKYTNGMAEHVMPAPLPQEKYEEVCAMAVTAHKALGCRGLTRSDFRYNEAGDGVFYILETNTQPGMTELSLAPEIAAHAGLSFHQLVTSLLESAQVGNAW